LLLRYRLDSVEESSIDCSGFFNDAAICSSNTQQRAAKNGETSYLTFCELTSLSTGLLRMSIAWTDFGAFSRKSNTAIEEFSICSIKPQSVQRVQKPGLLRFSIVRPCKPRRYGSGRRRR
jgi:hypothetical protein